LHSGHAELPADGSGTELAKPDGAEGRRTERMTLADARNQSPSVVRFRVCRLKEEKVV
jgi:hypothetical protein